jgi:hypothetical protein
MQTIAIKGKMQMRCKNGIKICVASHYCNKSFSHSCIFFRIAFASHYHPWFLPAVPLSWDFEWRSPSSHTQEANCTG